MVLRFLFLRPKKANTPSIRPLKQKKAQRKKRNNKPARTPMTIPAMAPPLRPLLAVVEAVPAALLALVADADAVMKGTVVVIEPVDVTVVATLVVDESCVGGSGGGGHYRVQIGTAEPTVSIACCALAGISAILSHSAADGPAGALIH